MDAVETGHFEPLEDLAHEIRDSFDRRGRGALGHAEAKGDPALGHAFEVAHPALDQVGVGKDDLLAPHAPHPGCLHPDSLDGPHVFARLDEVADLERPVEQDRHRAKDVAEDPLERKADGDSSDTQPSQEAG